MTKNNKGNLFVFEVGPSVKFVSAIKDAIFNKKNGGSLAKDHIFSVFFFFAPFPYNDGVRISYYGYDDGVKIKLMSVQYPLHALGLKNQEPQ